MFTEVKILNPLILHYFLYCILGRTLIKAKDNVKYSVYRPNVVAVSMYLRLGKIVTHKKYINVYTCKHTMDIIILDSSRLGYTLLKGSIHEPILNVYVSIK